VKLLDPEALAGGPAIRGDVPALVVLAAGKGTRFGVAPKCIQPVRGKPLARHTIEAFRRFLAGPVVCMVGYRHEEVAAALGPGNICVRSANPVGGTAFAAYESLSVPGLLQQNPLLVITMGDRIVTAAVFRELVETHRAGNREADLTFLTAWYEPPRHLGKGRVLRDAKGGVLRIVEQKDIDVVADGAERQALQDLTEGNCPLYAVRAATLARHLGDLTNANAQGQYYLTDLIAAIHDAQGDIRTITTSVDRPDYDLLCADVTRPTDLALLEGALDVCAVRAAAAPAMDNSEIERAARQLAAGRPAGQVASIARQIEELYAAATREKLGFTPDAPVAIGVVGGRMRIAFMHPDMVRFFGPAWQMPIGAADSRGDEQIVMLAQTADDRQIHFHSTNAKYREIVDALPVAADEAMFPGEGVADWHTYEVFGTRMSEHLLLALGYFSDTELAGRRERGQPLPPPALWVANNMRRPFSLVGNAIASLRTLRDGALGARAQRFLGRDSFQGLRFASTGGIPQGGFSSSSALTLATKNALNALYDLGIPPDLLVHLAAQAEYGTGVRAGSLDQAAEQKGMAGQGALISSNPRDNYRVLGTYDMPAKRIRILFPYSVARDSEAWRWSWGAYAEKSGPGPLTSGEMRKLTGKAAELAALLVRLPLETDFFKCIEDDLVDDGALDPANQTWIAGVLRKLPLLATQEELRDRLRDQRAWLIDQFIESSRLSPQAASQKADATLTGLLAGWHDPVLRRMRPDGQCVEECGVPLRAMVAYLFAEVVKNFHCIRHQEHWIEDVRLSQRGDCCVDIAPSRLPSRAELESELAWERPVAGPARLDAWLTRCGATPFDYNRGLDDASLSPEALPDLRTLAGSNFFRGLALIDLAEAMLTRAFGADAVAVRVNAAGQGDFFQMHVDTHRADPEDVKRFLRAAFFRRFGLTPNPDIVDIHPGGGAAGVRLSRLDVLPRLAERLRS
jgi:bifunctional UDP-N-acetylglucosamine pyrophosphorylase/glucosamine-1-phosphate N-acetyltransferase